MKKTIAIDIDGTLRNIDEKIRSLLKIDHPHRVKAFDEFCEYWDRLDKCFNNDREAVLKWMYDDRPFQIFGLAGKMYTRVIDHVNALVKMTEQTEEYEIIISSVQSKQSIPATLFWLSKHGCKAKHIHFFDTFDKKMKERYNYVIDDHPIVLEQVKKNCNIPIVVPHPYNEHLKEKDGYHRLDYSGKNPKGLAGVVDIIGLNAYQVIGE